MGSGNRDKDIDKILTPAHIELIEYVVEIVSKSTEMERELILAHYENRYVSKYTSERVKSAVYMTLADYIGKSPPKYAEMRRTGIKPENAMQDLSWPICQFADMISNDKDIAGHPFNKSIENMLEQTERLN